MLEEQMVTVDTPNKKNASEDIFESYFSSTHGHKYCVSYLLIIQTSDTKTKTNILDKVILQIHTAITDLDEIVYGDISNKNKFTIKTKTTELSVKMNTENSDTENEFLWEISFEGEFQFLEAFRSKFLLAIKDVCLKKYCLQDQISDEICVVAYPKVRQLENILREYLLRFFSKKFGSIWWKQNTNHQLESKLKDKSERRAFHGILDMELFSIDFIDLTQLLDSKSSEMESHELIEALDNIVKSRENVDKFNRKVERIKNRYVGNWKKFFESSIKIENFIKTWQDLYEIRCEVAHNALINLNRFSRLILLHSQIMQQINTLIDNLRIIKSLEYELLDKILEFKYKLSKEDVNSFINSNVIHITPQNFKKEIVTIDEFSEYVSVLKEDMKILGEFDVSDIQLNIDDEEDVDPNALYSAISVSVYFVKVSDVAKGALDIGLLNSKFD